MTVSEAIKWLLSLDLNEINNIVRQKAHNDHIWHMVKKQRDTIQKLRDDEYRTALILDAMCRKIDELSSPGTGKGFLKTLYLINDPELLRDIPYRAKGGEYENQG